jgi:EAL domain-containing protein (putative c-di-GMP-specific phosphodiesterase class I)
MFYVTTPSPRAKSVIASELKRCELSSSEPYQDVLAVRFQPEKFERFSKGLAAELAPEDLQQTRCRIVSDDVVPSPAELMQTQTLDNFLTWIRNQWLSHLIRERRLTTWFQPIVECHMPHRVFAYECLLRGMQPDGEVIPPELLFAAARATDQLAALDTAAKRIHIESAARQGLSSRVFINFSPLPVQESEDCLEETLAAIARTGLPPAQFVFEVVESDRTADVQALTRILNVYRKQGLKVALDDLGAGYNSLNLLTEIKPDFIKLDMHLMRNIDRDPYKSRVASKVLELAQELQIRTVVEGVETPGQWQWASDHGANYAQGFLFAKPAPTPPQPRFRPEMV